MPRVQRVMLEGRGVNIQYHQKEEEKLSEMDCDSVNYMIGLSTMYKHSV